MTVEDERQQLQLVAGYDHPAGGDAAVHAAARFAELIGATVHVVHAVEPTDCGVDAEVQEHLTRRDLRLAECRAAVAQLFTQLPGRLSYHEPHGDPARCLAQVADLVGAYAVVVVADHHGFWHQAAGRNVVQRLLKHHHRRPLLVLPPPDRSAGGD